MRLDVKPDQIGTKTIYHFAPPRGDVEGPWGWATGCARRLPTLASGLFSLISRGSSANEW